jgi:hypothetical protein
MIQTPEQLHQAIEEIQNLCGALDSLRADVFPKNPRNFAVLAEGPLDQIRQLQAQLTLTCGGSKERSLERHRL